MKVEIEFPQKYVDYAKEQGLTESEIEKILKQEIEMAMGIGDFVLVLMMHLKNIKDM